MDYDLIVRGAQGDIAVADGVIAALGRELEGSAREELDARGLLLLPGVVDAHVHVNEPGRTEWEGWEFAGAAFAAGGTTTAIDMPLNSSPPTLDGAAFDAKAAAAAAASPVDFALWGGLVPGQPLDSLDELAARGVVGFKAFMSNSGIEEFPAADDETLAAGMARAARLGLPVAVHAESDELTGELAWQAWSEGRSSMRDYIASRPVEAETEAIGRALALAAETGCALHVVHVSSGAGVALVAEARARGVDASCETCPHYLVLDEDDAERIGTVAKCAPPLRPRAELEALWEALEDGRVPMVASDHSPSPPELKRGGAFEAWGGIAGGQTLLTLLTGSGRLDAEALADCTSGFPARRFRLDGKGRLAVGADADFVTVNPSVRWTLSPGDLLSRHHLSPFVGRDLRARVVHTIVRGRTVYAHGRVRATSGGRLVRPGAA